MYKPESILHEYNITVWYLTVQDYLAMRESLTASIDGYWIHADLLTKLLCGRKQWYSLYQKRHNIGRKRSEWRRQLKWVGNNISNEQNMSTFNIRTKTFLIQASSYETRQFT